jgi:acetyl esterase/lipase
MRGKNPVKTASLLSVVTLAALALGMASRASADEGTPPPVHVGGGLAYPPYTMTMQSWYRDIVYDKTARDTRDTSLDIYVNDPVAPGSPVMIWVHGGGFRVSDKASSKELASKPEYFTNKLGYILVSINYRLLPDGQYPRNVQDVANALAWVHDNIAKFGGDPSQIFLMGHSAGAQLVAQVGTDPAFLKNAGKDLSILKGVIANEGPYNFPTGEYRFAAGTHIPPFLLLAVKGGSDMIPDSEQQANGLAHALRSAGVPVEVTLLDHVQHFGANERMGQPGDITTAALENFLASIPGKKRAPGWVAWKPPG